MKKVIILGSTGSLGVQAIKVLGKYKNEFKIIGLSAKISSAKLKKQAELLEIKPKNALLTKGQQSKTETLKLIREADIVINVLSGVAGVMATKHSIKEKKTILLGNKESIVAEGKKIMKMARVGQIIPLDSEHNAIFEILKKHPGKKIKKITIPCSGGPFFKKTCADLDTLTAKDALKHPKWKMGKKISLESALLINKGFEIIEAHHLFSLPLSKIDTKIHPECQIHGIVEFEGEDSEIAYISPPDMCEHIENALLHILGKSRPQKRIRSLPKKYKLHEIDHKALPGIKIVLDNFKKYPEKMKNFLVKEEKILNNAIQKAPQTKISDLISQLKN